MLDRKNIQSVLSKITKQIRDFLLSKKNREFLIFLFFFFVASVFWLIQTLNYDYEAEFAIPLRLKNVPDNVVLTLPPPQEIHVTVKDKGTVLMNYMFGQSIYPITLDFKDYSKSGNQIRILSSSLQKSIASQLVTSSKISSIKPDTLDIIYTHGKAKKIPVQLTGHYTAGQQYYISKIQYRPDSVTVFAPERMLDTIRRAYTEPIELKNMTDTTHTRTALRRIKGAKFVPNFVDVRFLVDIYTEKTVEVPIIGTGFPANKSLKTFPSKVKVTFQVGLSRFKNITADMFSIEIPYKELQEYKTDKYTVELKNMPKDISHIRISPQEIDFIIEQNTLNGN